MASISINDELFCDVLKRKRKEAKMTQEELAEKIGTSSASVRRYESNDSVPNMGTLGLICIALNCTDDALVDSWSQRMANKSGEDSRNEVLRAKQKNFIVAKDSIAKQYWDKVVNQGRWQFQSRLVPVAQCFQRMNVQGYKKCIEIIEALSKVPDYQLNETEWAFKPDSPREVASNDEDEAESE